MLWEINFVVVVGKNVKFTVANRAEDGCGLQGGRHA